MCISGGVSWENVIYPLRSQKILVGSEGGGFLEVLKSPFFVFLTVFVIFGKIGLIFRAQTRPCLNPSFETDGFSTSL